ncbi:hypothetical protein, partial [Ruminococcus sp.]
LLSSISSKYFFITDFLHFNGFIFLFVNYNIFLDFFHAVALVFFRRILANSAETWYNRQQKVWWIL